MSLARGEERREKGKSKRINPISAVIPLISVELQEDALSVICILDSQLHREMPHTWSSSMQMSAQSKQHHSGAHHTLTNHSFGVCNGQSATHARPLPASKWPVSVLKCRLAPQLRAPVLLRHCPTPTECVIRPTRAILVRGEREREWCMLSPQSICLNLN